MRLPKVIEILKKLSPEQMQRLGDFVSSPYFNNDENVVIIYDYLLLNYPHFKAEKTGKEAFLKNIKSLKGENDLFKRMAKLNELTRKFLSLEFSQDLVLEKIGTLKAFKKLQLNKDFEILEKQIRDELKKVAFKDFDHLWREHRLEEEAFEGFDKKIVRNAENSMEKVFDSLSRFNLIKKLRFMTQAVYRERLVGIKVGNDLKEEVIHFLDSNVTNDDPYLFIYGNLFRMNLEKSSEKALPFYQKAKSAIDKFSNEIPQNEVRAICDYLQNFCIYQINKESKNFTREFITIIQFRIHKDILLTNNLLSPILYKNVIGAAIKLNEIDWAQDFITSFTKNLPDSFKDDYYNCSIGQLLYNRGDLKKACQHLALASHNKQDVYFGFFVKKLLLRIGYESSDPFLESYIDAYRKHLERHRKKIGENAQLLDKFFSHYRMLERARWDKKGMEILLNRLIEEENFPDRDWLIAMARKNLKIGAIPA